MIFIHQSTPQHHPCVGPEVYRHPASAKAYFTTCSKDEKKTTSETQNKDHPKQDSTATSNSTSESQRVFVERAPIHFQETEGAAKIALDVAGFSPQEIQVRVEDFVVSIDAKRVNKLGDTYVIRRRFRVDKSTVVEDKVHASLNDNILEVVVPKKAKVGPRSIPISTTATTVTPSKKAEEKEETKETDKTETDQSANEKEEIAPPASSSNYDQTEKEQDTNIKVEQAQHDAVEEESWEDVKE